jgi:hypothetical protein
MARKKFTLAVDGDNPQGPGQGHVMNPNNPMDIAEFNAMLSQGRLKSVGYVYQGDFATVDTQSGTDTENAAILDVRCIVVYVGGSAYKICV